jgi:hypothetical protein
VVRGDAALNQTAAMLMRSDFGKFAQKIPDKSRFASVAFRRLPFAINQARPSVAASSQRRRVGRKNNSRQQIIIAQCRDTFRGGISGSLNFH